MHHNAFIWINQPGAATSQVYYLSFKYSSTCFGHPHAHHQKFNNCSSRPARPRPTALLSPSSDGKPEAATAVVELLMMGMRIPETCWAVFKRQIVNLRNWCMWLVDSIESMMMHGLANPKYAVMLDSLITTYVQFVIMETELQKVHNVCFFMVNELTGGNFLCQRTC